MTQGDGDDRDEHDDDSDLHEEEEEAQALPVQLGVLLCWVALVFMLSMATSVSWYEPAWQGGKSKEGKERGKKRMSEIMEI